MKRFATLVLFTAAIAFAASVKAQDIQRGIANYRAIVTGQKNYNTLTPAEQLEVQYVIRALQARDDASGSSDCRDAKQRARDAASELASYAARLKRCAESGDITDDCDSEFRRTRNAHDDYESAVSEVQSYCD